MECCLNPFLRPPRNRSNTIKIEDFIIDFTDTVSHLEKKAIGASVIINPRMEPDSDLMLYSLSESAVILNEPYTSQRMVGIFKNKKSRLHDGALVINLFDEPTIFSASCKLPMDTMQKWQKVPLELVHLGARHGSAYSVSQCCFRALVVVVSEEKGRVSVFKGGKFELGVTKKKIAQELLTMYQKNNGVSLDQGLLFDQKHFKAKVTTQMFDPNDDVHVDWYYRHITKCRVQLYKGNEYKTNSSIKPGDMALKCKQKEVRKANETRLLKLKYIEIVKLKIILYNGMPFGGIRYNLCLATRTIDLDLLNAFVEREHFQNGLLAYILQEQLFKEFYPIFNKITFRFEPHLRERIEKFVSDLKIEVDSSDKQFLYYTIHISGANDAGSSSTSSALSLHSSGSAYINPVVPVPSTPLNANLVEENCESLVIRVRKNDIFLHLDVAITRHINWIRPNSIVAKQLKVGDKIVGIKGVEFSMELEHLERMMRQCSEFVDLQISRAINREVDYTNDLSLLP